MEQHVTSRSLWGLAMLTLAIVCFSVSVILTKVAANMGIPGGETAFIRLFALALYCLSPAHLSRMRFRHKPLLLVRGVAGGLSIVCLYVALANLGVSVSKLLLLSQPVFAAILGVCLWKKLPKPATVWGLLITTVGVTTVVAVTNSSGYLISKWQSFAISSAFFGAISLISVEELQRKGALNPREEVDADILGAFALIGTLSALPFSLWEQWVFPTTTGWAVLALVAIGSSCGQLLMIRHMRGVGAVTFTIMLQLNPVFTVAMSWYFLSEVLPGLAIIGGVITVVGVFIASITKSSEKEASTS